MPFDAAGFPTRVLTTDEARDLAVLKGARYRIRHSWMWWKHSNWCWHIMPAVWGGACPILALGRTTGECNEAYTSCFSRIQAQLPSGSSDIGDFNDARTTTHADILALFDRAIAAIEGV